MLWESLSPDDKGSDCRLITRKDIAWTLLTCFIRIPYFYAPRESV